MLRTSLTLATLLSLSVCHSACGQTWSIDPLGSSVLMNSYAEANHFAPPLPEHNSNAQSSGTFQTPFVDLGGEVFSIGDNNGVIVNAGSVSNATGWNYVKANDSSAPMSSGLSIEWRAAAGLDMQGDAIYDGNANADLTSTLSVELSGLIPGETYRISYGYRVAAYAIEEHEGPMGPEDPVNANSALDFTFGMNPAESFSAIAGPSAGLLPVEDFSGNGSYLLLATGAPVILTVNISAAADAFFTNDFIVPGTPRDFADSDGWGTLDFSVQLIPEPSSILLLAMACATLCLPSRRNRSRLGPVCPLS